MTAVKREQFIGVVSDTHGLLRPEATAALQGAITILHAGDIGSADVIQRLSTIAPVVAIRGNIDSGAWARVYPASELVQIENIYFYIIHDVKELDIDLEAAGVNIVISGHSHRPKIERRNGVTFVNPGSCGPRRFSLPVSLARIWLTDNRPAPELVDLQD